MKGELLLLATALFGIAGWVVRYVATRKFLARAKLNGIATKARDRYDSLFDAISKQITQVEILEDMVRQHMASLPNNPASSAARHDAEALLSTLTRLRSSNINLREIGSCKNVFNSAIVNWDGANQDHPADNTASPPRGEGARL